MLWIAAGVLLALIWWSCRRPLARLLDRAAWRPVLSVLVLVALVGAGAAMLRGAWLPGLLGVAIALWAGLFVRRSSTRPPPHVDTSPPPRMSKPEARALLGVSDVATTADIQEAYRRLMRRAHPDLGGTTGLAAQLNAARATLLDGGAP